MLKTWGKLSDIRLKFLCCHAFLHCVDEFRRPFSVANDSDIIASVFQGSGQIAASGALADCRYHQVSIHSLFHFFSIGFAILQRNLAVLYQADRISEGGTCP